eukprot:4354875-Pyramimonas_sp.AAC.2
MIVSRQCEETARVPAFLTPRLRKNNTPTSAPTSDPRPQLVRPPPDWPEKRGSLVGALVGAFFFLKWGVTASSTAPRE